MVEGVRISELGTKARRVWGLATVEPMLACYTIGYIISSLAMQNLNLDKACRVNLAYNTTVCDALTARDTAGYEAAEEAVQEKVTSMGIWKTFLQSFLPALLIPFIGSWSDRRHRRKPAMLLPLTGEMMTIFGFILCTYYFYQLPMEVSGLTEAFFPAVTGGWMTMYMAVFSYMGDTTSVGDRTLRIGIVNLCSSVSVPIGTLISGFLFQMIGYYGVFVTSTSMHMLSFIYGYTKVKEEKPNPVAKEKNDCEKDESQIKGLLAFLADFFDVRYIRETIKVAFKKGKHNQRTRVILLMVVVIVVSGPWQDSKGASLVVRVVMAGLVRNVVKISKILVSEMTVEPMLALYVMGYTVSGLAMQNLNLDKACRVNLAYNTTVCDALTLRETANYMDAEEAVQDKVTSMGVWKSFVQSFFPALLIPFIGSWSDRRHRRKPCWQVPLVGELLTNVAYVLSTYYFYELPMEVCGVSEAIIPSITGGWMTLYMAVFSYLGDVTSVESRTLRMGLLGIWPSVSVTLGQSVSGLLVRWIGYYGVFGISSIIICTAIYFGQRVQESLPPPEQETPVVQGIIPILKDFFDTKNIKETLKVVFEKGNNHRRLKVIIILVCAIVVMGPPTGELNVLYNFTRLRFNWNEVDYSYFLTFIMVINLIGTSITVGVFSHMMKMDDAVIGIISCMSKILAGFIYAFATTTWMMYLAPIVDIANGTSYIAMRSIASKLVPPDELGKLNSVFGMAEAIVPVIYGPMYNAIYNATRQTVPGAFYLVGGALTAPAVFIFLWLYGQHKQDAARLSKEETEKGKADDLEKETNFEVDGKNGTIEMENMATADHSHSNEAFQQDNENSKT